MVAEDRRTVPQVEFARDKFLAKDIIVLDGLTGTGKTMFSPIIASLEGVQNPRFEYMFEYLLISAKLGKISRDALFSLLNLLADVKFYDGLISRDVNFRPTDLSGVLANRKLLRYVRQLFMKDGPAIENRLRTNKDILFLITHQILGCLEELKYSFKGRVKVIQTVRHPLYLIDHWLSYIDMHGSNPRDFTIWLEAGGARAAPWFAEGRLRDFNKMSRIEKVLFSIETLMEPVYRAKSDCDQAILFLPFEEFVLEPKPYLLDLYAFIGSNSTRDTTKALRDQKVPREIISSGLSKPIYKRYGFEESNKERGNVQDFERRIFRFKQKYGNDAHRKLSNMSERYERAFRPLSSRDRWGTT